MKPEIRPVFIDGTCGRLFGLHFPAGPAPRGALLYLPPFAEEMNRCRALAAEQARALAAAGISCLLLDPYGTGDSDGDLENATWAIWRDDALLATGWLAQAAGCRVSLWGLRLGGLLAGELFEAAPGQFERLLLWQPVSNGRQYLTQYLRLRVAWLMERGLPAETTDGIRATMADGTPVEVAGYLLAGDLAAGIDDARFPHGDSSLHGKRIDWLENAAEAGAPLSVAARRAVEQLQKLDAEVHATTFAGPPLWQLHKRDELPGLIEATCALFGESS